MPIASARMMQRDSEQPEMFAPPQAKRPVAEAMPRRALLWAMRGWRSAASAVAVALALLLGWHVVNGNHGLSAWEQKRVQDKELQKEIQELQQENATLQLRVERLKSDPDAIEREAREKLRYAKQGEVIVDLSNEAKPAAAPAGK